LKEQNEILAAIASTGNAPQIEGNSQFSEGIKKYFTEYYGKEFQECAQESLITFCNFHPKTQQEPLVQFCKGMRHFHMKESVINLKGIDMEIDLNIPMLLFLAREKVGISIQAKLIHYVKEGGILCIFGKFPEQEEQQEPRSILKDVFLSTVPQKLPSSHPKHSRKISSPQIGKIGKGFILHWMNNPIFKRTDLDHLINHTIRKKTKNRSQKLPKLHRSTVLTLNILLRFLQMQGITRKLEISLRTDYIFRHKIETFVYIHPSRDTFHIFLFNRDPKVKLPVSLHLFHPKRNLSVRIRTNLLGNTATLMRIEEGILTAISYTGVHHRAYEPLFLKVNASIFTTDSAIDIIALKNSHSVEIFTGETRLKTPTIFRGFISEPVTLDQQTHLKLK
jgi:hypothetical protein